MTSVSCAPVSDKGVELAADQIESDDEVYTDESYYEDIDEDLEYSDEFACDEDYTYSEEDFTYDEEEEEIVRAVVKSSRSLSGVRGPAVATSYTTKGTGMYATDQLISTIPIYGASGEGVILIKDSSGKLVTLANAFESNTLTRQRTASSVTAYYDVVGVRFTGGDILVAGGAPLATNASVPVATAYLTKPGGSTSTLSATLNTARKRYAAIRVDTNNVFFFGGMGTDGSALNSIERFDYSKRATASAFAVSRYKLSTARWGHRVVKISSGTYKNKYLIIGGENSSGAINQVEVFDPSTQRVSAPSALTLSKARVDFSLTQLADGKILIVGGRDGTTYHKTAEIFSPSTGTFSTTGSMSTARAKHAAIQLANGDVMVMGGINSNGLLKSTETYDTPSSSGSQTDQVAGRLDASAVALTVTKTSGAFASSASLTSAKASFVAFNFSDNAVSVGGVSSSSASASEDDDDDDTTESSDEVDTSTDCAEDDVECLAEDGAFEVDDLYNMMSEEDFESTDTSSCFLSPEEETTDEETTVEEEEIVEE